MTDTGAAPCEDVDNEGEDVGLGDGAAAGSGRACLPDVLDVDQIARSDIFTGVSIKSEFDSQSIAVMRH